MYYVEIASKLVLLVLCGEVLHLKHVNLDAQTDMNSLSLYCSPLLIILFWAN